VNQLQPCDRLGICFTPKIPVTTLTRKDAKQRKHKSATYSVVFLDEIAKEVPEFQDSLLR